MPATNQTLTKMPIPATAAVASLPSQDKSAFELKNNRIESNVENRQGYLADHRPVQRKANKNGLPDRLKLGVENLSGHSLDDVKVHYNSSKPAQLNAHAYAQGSNIHLAPGQEKHLPHEAWHVVQQKQGRVKPTLQLHNGVNINDSQALESEADTMGNKASFSRSSILSSLGIAQFKTAMPRPSGLILPFERNSYHGTGSATGLDSSLTIQLHYNRLVTDPFFTDARRTSQYFAGWVLEVIDLFSKGLLYDGFSLLLSMTGNSGMLSKIEEIVRFMQHHPEVLNLLGASLSPFIVSTFGVPVWVANIFLTVLSRGSLADAIGDLAFSMLMSGPFSNLLVAGVVEGMKRRLGRSLINRGLIFAYNIGGAIGSLVSGISRLFHGYSLNPGTMLAPGTKMETPGSEFGSVYNLISHWMPLERLHIIPNLRGGVINTENAAYGAAATNSLMIPHEARGYEATAVQSPSGMLESMGMKMGLFLGRGMRPREGYFEHQVNTKIGLA